MSGLRDNPPAEQARLRRQLAAIAGVSTALLVVDNAGEHYRGSFRKPLMWAPLALSPLAAAAGIATSVSGSRVARGSLLGLSILQVLSGAVGFAAHQRGVRERPGVGLHAYLFNAWYGPPVMAPLQYVSLGSLGVLASAPSPIGDAIERRVGWTRIGRLLLATSIPPLWLEITYLHARGAYQNRLQWVPVVALPVVGSASALATVREEAAPLHRAAAVATVVLGVVGTVAHAAGARRQYGGLGRQSGFQNWLTGPPVPAPLQMIGTGLAALAAERARSPR